MLRLANGTDSFRAKNRSEFSFQSIGDISVVCSIAMQNGESFLFLTFSLNGDDGASHFGLPFKDARGFFCCTLSRFNSFLIRDEIFA